MKDEKKTPNNLFIELESEHVIFDSISNGITITDPHSTILYTNPAFTKITGYSKEEVLGKNPGMLHSGRHKRSFYEAMWEAISTKGFWEGEIWNRRKSGQIFPEYLTISKINQNDENKFYYIAIFSDITYLKKDISKKLHLAFYDPLTELPNRALYLDRINQQIEQGEKDKNKTMAICYMDLDKFKQVNDTYGHCVGDKLLKKVGQRLASRVKSGDTIARIGGDEFAAILTIEGNKEAVNDLSKEIVSDIEAPFLIEGHDIHISISIGITFYPHTKDVETLLVQADKAMYLAKKSGSKIEFYDLKSMG